MEGTSEVNEGSALVSKNNSAILSFRWSIMDTFMYLSLALKYRGAGKSLARPGSKQATAIEDFEFHISYL